MHVGVDQPGDQNFVVRERHHVVALDAVVAHRGDNAVGDPDIDVPNGAVDEGGCCAHNQVKMCCHERESSREPDVCAVPWAKS